MFRPLKDTSPSSLPHTSTRPTAPGLVPDSANTAFKAPNDIGGHPNFVDSPVSVSPRATVTPGIRGELSQPSDAGDDDDGSTLIGRATNIANTAKDLLGALWYGSQEEAGRARPAPRQHRRGASLG